MSAPDADRPGWSLAGEMLTRPYPLRMRVVLPAVTLMVLIPFYLVIAAVTADRTLHAPELALDRMVPVQSAWSVIYLSYLLSPFLPLLILRQEEHIRRTFLAWLMAWSVGYVCFLVSWPEWVRSRKLTSACARQSLAGKCHFPRPSPASNGSVNAGLLARTFHT